MARGRQPIEGEEKSLPGLGITSAQTLRCHELGGFEEQKKDQRGWNEVYELERGNWLGKKISWGLILESVDHDHVIPGPCCSFIFKLKETQESVSS